jgi:transcriptional regulator with XRE-family HTH domain
LQQTSTSPEDVGMDMADVIRQRRAELGISQADLAAKVGLDKRQIRRYESGEQQPLLSVAASIADALGISLNELAGTPDHRVNLSGDWWSSWQTFKDGREVITVQPVHFAQRGELINWHAVDRGIDVVDGGYLWRGELRLWDNEILMGWYAADDGAVRSKGTVYFVLHPHGVSLTGRWVGLSYDGSIITGWGATAKTKEEARELIDQLKEGVAT